MMFQKLTTLAAFLLYASNAALAAPVPQLPVPDLSSVTQPLGMVDGVVGTAGSLVGTAENLVGGPLSSVTPVLSNVPIVGNVVRDGLTSLDSFVPSGVSSVGGMTAEQVVDAVINEIVPPAVKGVVRRDTLPALPVTVPTLPVVGDLSSVGDMNLPVVGSLLPSVVPNVENII